MDLILAFITGLTTGGLSCLAVQGGLLASSIAHEVEQSVRDTDARHPRAARPIVLFLAAKLVAYTVLGLFLGLLGSVLQLSATTRALLQAAVGVFMVGTALRMFNVHPIFRYFALEPPSFVTRYIRRKAKGDASAVTPIFLGALTVLIPCGVTQAMMAVAMGTGSAVAGATTMFAFILGTSPVFFVVAYLATRLGSRLEAGFMRFAAIVVLVLGLVAIDAGLTLAGWPYSVSNLRLAATGGAGVTTAAAAPGPTLSASAQNATLPPDSPTSAAGAYVGPLSPQATADASTANVLTINVVNSGYQPNVLHAKAGEAIKMALVTKNTRGCARALCCAVARDSKDPSGHRYRNDRRAPADRREQALL